METLGDLGRSSLLETAKHFGFVDECVHKGMFVWPDTASAPSIRNASLGMSLFNERVLQPGRSVKYGFHLLS
jgi:hypothetical protein